MERQASADRLSDSGRPSIRLLEVEQPAFNHNGGCIAFGNDGMLYAAFGDGGPQKDPVGYSQNPRELLGSMVRIDVDRRDDGRPYTIPPGNPFLATHRADPLIRPETWAIGFREPWRFSFDNTTGKLWAADVGQGAWEEVNVITPGSNYGWNVREGAHCFNPATGCANTFVEPITEYDHSLGRSITGGFVYRGTAVTELVSWYLFGDFGSGRIFGVRENSTAGQALEILDESGLQIVSFGRGVDGELYVLHFGGTIHQIVDAP